MRYSLLSLILLLAACGQSNSVPPPTPPPAPAEDQATDLRDAMQAPLDRARAVEQTLQEDADHTRQAVEDAGG